MKAKKILTTVLTTTSVMTGTLIIGSNMVTHHNSDKVSQIKVNSEISQETQPSTTNTPAPETQPDEQTTYIDGTGEHVIVNGMTEEQANSELGSRIILNGHSYVGKNTGLTYNETDLSPEEAFHYRYDAVFTCVNNGGVIYVAYKE